MIRTNKVLLAALLALLPALPAASADDRVAVELPQMMREHMLANMRDHLAAINEILGYLGNGELDRAAETAEYRLGMSSLESHGASHMAKFMPQAMREAGTTMHQSASRFARIAQEGDALTAYRALADVTAACVACHSGFRVKP